MTRAATSAAPVQSTAGAVPAWRSRTIAGAALLPFVAILLAHTDVVPVFDSWLYTDCLTDALVDAPDPRGLNCFGHPTAAYLLPVAIARFFAPGWYGAVIVANALLGAFALLALRDIAALAFPGQDRALDRWLIVLAAGVHPVLLSSALNLNPDFGVTVFFLLTVRALLRGSVAGAALWGAALTFSKEPGIVLYLLAAGLHTIMFVLPGPAEGRARRLLRLWPLAIPPALALLFYATAAGVWMNPAQPSAPIADQVLRAPLDVFLAYSAAILVLQFTWVPMVLIVGHLGLCARAAVSRAPLPHSGVETYLWLLFGAAFIALTRLPTFVNPRYFLPIAPLLLLCFASALGALRPPRTAVRATALAGVALLFLISAFRTVDPVSRALFGTFAFGDRQLLSITSLTHECCGSGRDQIVYNLEFTQFHRLVDQVYERFPLESDARYAADGLADWHLMGRIDARTRSRTIDRRDSSAPSLCSADSISVAAVKPRKLYFIDFPFLRPDRDLPKLAQTYDLTAAHQLDQGGYRLRVLEMERRHGSVQGPRSNLTAGGSR